MIDDTCEEEYKVLEYRLADKSIEPLIDLTLKSKASNAIGAENDLEAVSIWLARYVNENTVKAYYKDVNRFIYWLTFVGGKSLAGFTVADLNRYIAFLKNPPANWCMPEKKHKRYHLQWRPFNGPLQKNALNYAIVVLNSLFSFLENASYIKKNPVKLLQKRVVLASIDEQRVKVWERTLDNQEWQAVISAIALLPEITASAKLQKAKIQMLFACLYLLGLRIHEASEAKYSNLQKVNDAWWFVLYGKGDKLGTIPANEQFIEILNLYRSAQNLATDFGGDDNYIFTNKTGVQFTTRTLYNLVKHIGEMAAEHVPAEHQKQKLKSLSPHWLRHLSATHQSRLGTPIEIIKDNHRHSSMQTTEIYMHSDNDLRQEFMRKHTIDLQLPRIDKSVIEADRTKIIIKFINKNPAQQFLDTIIAFMRQQLLVGYTILKASLNDKEDEYWIEVAEQDVRINFDSLAIIAKVWGMVINVTIHASEKSLAI
jgi:site-specific recombinase XerD